MPKRPMTQQSEKHMPDRINRGRRTYIGALGRLTGNALREQALTGREPYRLHLLNKALAPKTLPLPSLSPEVHKKYPK